MKKISVLVLVAASTVVLLAGCTTPTTSVTPTDNTPVDFTLNASSFTITPKTFQVEAGKTYQVRVNVTNDQHHIVIPELGFDTGVLNGGQSKVVTLTIPAGTSGKTYTYYCSIDSHRQKGMEGTITVK